MASEILGVPVRRVAFWTLAAHMRNHTVLQRSAYVPPPAFSMAGGNTQGHIVARCGTAPVQAIASLMVVARRQDRTAVQHVVV